MIAVEVYAVEMKGITKSFPGVTALDKVDFAAKEGEVHCLLGENGAGKSTLIKILAGVYQPDRGDIFINGRKVAFRNPSESLAAGVSIVYQERRYIPNLTVAENIYFGRYPQKTRNLIDFRTLNSRVRGILEKLRINVSPTRIMGELSSSQLQMVEIAKAYSMGAQIMVLDEASSSITKSELQELFRLIRELKKEGKTFIYISHRMEEIFEIGDRVTILKDGRLIDVTNVVGAEQGELVQKMVGRKMGKYFPPKNRVPMQEVLRVKNLSNDKVHNANIVVNKGEIVGLAGLVGSGRTELVESFFGVRKVTGGEIYFNGEKADLSNPRAAIKKKIGFITEERKLTGLILNKPIIFNISLPSLKSLSRLGVINEGEELRMAQELGVRLEIKTPSLRRETETLSGGNQQKVVLAKWLASEPELLICDEPTKGIDVGTKQEFYKLMDTLARKGLGVLVISSELPEIIGLCDRVYVMHEGEIKAELVHDEITEYEIIKYAMGGN